MNVCTSAMKRNSDFRTRLIVRLAGPAAEKYETAPPGWRTVRSREEVIALHESAHAVAAFLAGRRLLMLSIIPSLRSLGHVTYGGKSSDAAPETLLDEMMIFGEPDGISDRRSVLQILAAMPALERRAIHRMFRELEAEVSELVRTNWKTILLLANELVAQQWIGGRRAEGIISSTLAAQPEAGAWTPPAGLLDWRAALHRAGTAATFA